MNFSHRKLEITMDAPLELEHSWLNHFSFCQKAITESLFTKESKENFWQALRTIWILQLFWKRGLVSANGSKTKYLEMLLNNSQVSSNLLGHILLFWKITKQAFQKSLNFQ